MSNYSKTLVASATATLNNDAQAAALTSLGRAVAAGENATKRATKAYADANIHPAFLVSPYDKQGNVNPKSLSKATPEQYDAQSLLFAAGFGACNKGLAVATNVELFNYDHAKARERLTIIKDAMKNTSDKAAKAKLSKEAETINATLTARNELKRKIGPKFRDLAQALITEYKRRAKAKDGSEAANELVKKLKAESFGSAKTTGDKDATPKDADKVMFQQLQNALNALQAAENPPANINKLVAELTKALEPNP